MKTKRIIYWVLTGLLCFMLAAIGTLQLMPPSPEAVEVGKLIGYPQSVNWLLGVAKWLAVIGLLQPWFQTVKEWAYAGLTFNLIGAAYAFIIIDRPADAIVPLVMLGMVLASYFLWKQLVKQYATEPQPVTT
jgi:hypothetical protein